MTARRAAGPLAAALFGLLVAIGVAPAAGLDVVITPASPAPGDIVVVHVKGGAPDLDGEWGDRPLRFFAVPDGLMALVGVDLDVPPGPLAWRLRPRGSLGGEPLAAGVVSVGTRDFSVQQLTLPPAQVDLDARTVARVRSEERAFQTALGTGASARLWRGPFREPLDGGRPTGGFGLRRLINGQPRQPHAGYDWAARAGTPVMAANAGRVALVADHFFAGRLILLDHGQRLFTMYFHLSETRVSVGARVARGQRIGRVGATGRATGPHLHFGVLLDGARVDPMALFALPLPEPS